MSGSPEHRAAKRLFGTDPLGAASVTSGLVQVAIDGARPQVSVAASRASKYVQLWLDPEEAGKVADLLDLIAYATPVQMQRTAKGIRDAIETISATGERPAPARPGGLSAEDFGRPCRRLRKLTAGPPSEEP